MAEYEWEAEQGEYTIDFALTKKIEVLVSDCDIGGRWRPSVAQIKLQELGEENATSFGLPYGELLRRGMCWVLYRQQINLRVIPKALDVVYATTWPGVVAGPIFPRYYTLEKDGLRIGEAVTTWVLIDVESRRPLRPAVLEGQVPQVRDIPEPMPLPSMLRIENAQQVLERKVQYGDIDVNGHMNNAKYTDWVCDILPIDRLRASGIRGWQVNYIAEALPGECLVLSILEEADATYVQGKKTHNGRVAFDAKVWYGK